MNSTNKVSLNFGTRGWWVVIYTTILYALSNVVTGIIQVSGPALANMRQWDYASIMGLVTFGGWISIVLTLLFAKWTTRRGVKIPSVIFIVIYGIAMMLHGTASWPVYVIAALALSAISSTINMVTPNCLLTSWFPRKKGVVLGIATAGMMASAILTTPIFAGLTGKGGLGFAFNVFGIVLIIFAVITLLFIKNTPKEAGAYPDNDPASEGITRENVECAWKFADLLKNKDFWMLTIGFGLGFFALLGSVSTLVPTCMSLGMDQPKAIGINMICGCFAVVGSIVMGIVDQAWGTKRSTIIYAIGMIVGMGLRGIGGSGNIGLFIVGVMIFGFFQGALANLMISLTIQKYGPRNYPGVNALFSPLVIAIRTTAFLVIGKIAASSGYTSAAWFMTVILVISFLCLALVNPRTQESPAA